MDNAGVENVIPDSKGGKLGSEKCGSGKHGTRMHG